MGRWRQHIFLLALAVGGCGAQDVLLQTQKGYLFTAADAIAPPGEPVDLRVRLQAGDLLRGQRGCVVRFYRGGEFFKAAETDADGAAVVAFTPEKPGDEHFTAELSPNGFPGDPPGPVRLVLACRKPDAAMLVVDLDRTLVGSGFQQVMIGDPKPMAGSRRVMKRLAERYGVVYLTHRPDYFGPKSKAWLKKHAYPPGPLLLSDLGGFLSGSEKFKSGVLAGLRRRFHRLEMGIGDKPSDGQAYHDNGMKAFVILQPGEATRDEELEGLIAALEKLPDAVVAVTGWDQIESAVFGKASFPRSGLLGKLRKMLQARKAKNTKPGK